MVCVIPGFGSAVSVIGYCSGLGVQTVVCMFMVGEASVLTLKNSFFFPRQEEGWGHWQFFNFAWVKSWFGCLELNFLEVRNDYVVHFLTWWRRKNGEQFKNDVLFKNPFRDFLSLPQPFSLGRVGELLSGIQEVFLGKNVLMENIHHQLGEKKPGN